MENPSKSTDKSAEGAKRDVAEQPKKLYQDQPLAPSEREIDNLPGSGGSGEVR